MLNKIIKMSILASLAFSVNCGTFLNVLNANKGLHGYDYNGFIYNYTVRSESSADFTYSKKGSACQSSFVLSLFAIGDASLPEAKKKAGITKVTHMAFEKTRILAPFVYSSDCLIVFGE